VSRRQPRPVLVGDATDPHVDSVARQVRAHGGEPVILDAQRLRTAGFRVDDGGLALGAGGTGGLAQARRGWLRRLAPPPWAGGVAPDSHEGVVRASWLALLVGWVHTAPVTWLTPLPTLLRAENKSVQVATAQAVGIDVPRTLSTSSVEAVRETFGDHVLVKPLGPGHLVGTEGRGLMVPATVVPTADLGSDEVAACPFLFQEPLTARRHLRIVTVRDRSWVAALDADGLPVDWRQQDAAHDAFAPASDPRSTQAQAAASRLADRLGVGFSSQDWIDTGDRLVFLDLNPAGQWLFLPDEVAGPATAALGGWLGSES
jgi:hypothetical protein